MSKFIPNFKELSSKLYASASKTPEPTADSNVASAVTETEPTADSGVEQNRADGNVAQAVADGNVAQAVAEREVPPDPEKSPESQPQRRSLSLDQVKYFYNQNKILKELVGLLFSRRPVFLRYWFWLTLGLGGGAVALSTAWIDLERSLPESTVDVLTYVRDSTLTIKAADGSILEQQGPATRERLKIKQIPNTLVEAFIAIEDRRFYQHDGVDYQGVLRAVVSNLQARNVVEGGSTITQQLARIVFLDQQRSFWRKLREIRLAQKIEGSIDKEQVLERYLNLVYLGSGAYGVGDAAWVYFSKPVAELTLPEIATIAGLPPAPSEYSPLANKDAALKRRNLVLQQMQEAGYITPAQAKAAIATPLITKASPPKRFDRSAPYFSDYVQKELVKLSKQISPEILERGGFTVETTLDPQWQKVAEEAIAQTIKENGPGQNFREAAMVSLDPRTGQIKAMVGGKDFYKNQFNRVTQAKRQPGSTFKAFVYTTAIAAGFSPFKGYEDAPLTVDNYTPKNFSASFRGNLEMKDAIKYSINVIAVKILLDVGWTPVIKTAHKMGIESELHPTYSLALGASEVNLLELTSAYGTFATQGIHHKAYGIRRIVDRNGKILYQADFKPEQAINKETSAIMTWMLRGVVNEGTGRAAALDDRPVAGKTGTSDQARDLWFIGFIPQVVTGVWLGNDNNEPTWGYSGIAAGTWNQFMVKVLKGMPVEKFPELPENLNDRKPEIKAEPIKGKPITYGSVEPEENNTPRRTREREQNNDDAPPTRRQRRQEAEVEAPSPRVRNRNNESGSNNAPAETAPVRSAPRNSERSENVERTQIRPPSDSSESRKPSEPRPLPPVEPPGGR